MLLKEAIEERQEADVKAVEAFGGHLDDSQDV